MPAKMSNAKLQNIEPVERRTKRFCGLPSKNMEMPHGFGIAACPACSRQATGKTQFLSRKMFCKQCCRFPSQHLPAGRQVSPSSEQQLSMPQPPTEDSDRSYSIKSSAELLIVVRLPAGRRLPYSLSIGLTVNIDVPRATEYYMLPYPSLYASYCLCTL